jgi:hypothetical protein
VRRFGLLATAGVVLAHICGAAEACPWMNAATAGGIIGNPVEMNATKTSCEFIHRAGSRVYELVIQVEASGSARLTRCGSARVELKAIGNEAVACGFDGGEGKIAEQVVGRVRDQAFVIRISTNDRSAERAVLREKARKAAEQVAGNLF